MCHDNARCPCRLKRFQTHLKAGQTRRDTLDDREVLVVPVIMARSDVVMNGGLIPLEEFFPTSWDGRPVVIDHPTERGANISANDPVVIERSAIGQIFRTRVDGNALKAEAWIDIAKAEKVYPGLVSQLENGVEMDVSTGYFTEPEAQQGRENGRRYSELHRNIKPDHLAFLPNDQGACSWADGCGVRLNWRSGMKFTIEGLSDAAMYTGQQVKALVANITKTLGNARGEDDDARTIRADLISDDRTPFTPEDEMSLQYMSASALKALRDAYLKKSRKANAKSDEDEEGEEEVKPEDVKAMVDAAIGPLTKAMADLTANVAAITANVATLTTNMAKVTDAKRTDLVAKIVGNSAMKAEQLEKMDIATLEVIANGLPPKQPAPATNFAARAVPRAHADDEDKAILEAMSQNTGAVALFANRRKKEAA